MIVVRLMGGLGNQLFQYAAGRRLALERGVELVLDLGWFQYEAASFATPRMFELASVMLPARLVSLAPETIARFEQGLDARLGRWPTRRVRLHVLRQDPANAGVDARVLDAPDAALLIGYWQSERYFADRADAIRGEVCFSVSETDGWEKMLRAIRSSESVAVHIRRGDYVLVQRTNEVHGTLPADYYREAVGLVLERVPDASHAFLFSDDPHWVQNHLSFGIATTNVSLSSWKAPAELALMAACRHHVIANSSFSWWGAWLAERRGQVVVAPNAWFREASLNRNEIVPSRWIRI